MMLLGKVIKLAMTAQSDFPEDVLVREPEFVPFLNAEAERSGLVSRVVRQEAEFLDRDHREFRVHEADERQRAKFLAERFEFGVQRARGNPHHGRGKGKRLFFGQRVLRQTVIHFPLGAKRLPDFLKCPVLIHPRLPNLTSRIPGPSVRSGSRGRQTDRAA